MRKITILDTTLRDGEQTPGVQLSAARKLEIALQLERLGVDVIEAGFPAASPGDFRAVSDIAGALTAPAVSALARADRADIARAAEAVAAAAKPRVHVFLATSDIHLARKLGLSREDALARVRDCVAYAASLCPWVEFSAEDATRSDPDYLLAVLTAAADAGAKTLNVPDTVGYALPSEFSALVARVHDSLAAPRGLSLTVHCHNDLGLAAANSIAALAAGADGVECTVNGLGERAGNASLEEIVMTIATRAETLGMRTGINTPEIMRTSRIVAAHSGMSVPPGKAIVGANAFLHDAGIHQHGVLCDRATYEIIDPASVGLTEQTFVLGKLSGKHALRARLAQLGYKLNDDAVAAVFTHFKEIADRKREITDEDIMAIVNDYLDTLEGKYKLSGFQIQSGNHVRAMAMITLCERANPAAELSEAALGEGPVDAAFNAVKAALGITGVRLEAYGINAVTEGTDALGEATVRIRDGAGVSYTGRSVSSDIIKASIKAYLNAVNKLLAADAREKAEETE